MMSNTGGIMSSNTADVSNKTTVPKCDYCNTQNLIFSYEAPTTKRHLKVYVCNDCGLIQSWPRLSGVYKRTVAVSGGADWGYIRYGKQLRLKQSLLIIEKHINFGEINNVLDIGSNRGFLLEHLAKNYAHLNLTGIEPDINVINKDIDFAKLKIINKKLEDYDSNGEQYDFIHSSHTFEHMNSAKDGFKITYDLLKDGGYLYLELPRTELINRDNSIAEYFIDNHLYHFTSDTLANYLSDYNFDIIYKEVTDWENHVYILKKKSDVNLQNIKHFNKYKENDSMIRSYAINRENNLKIVTSAGILINKFINNGDKIAIWGMGRLFNIFYLNTNVEWNKIIYFVDKYLGMYVDNVNNISIDKPEILSGVKLDKLIIFSDIYAEEIKAESASYLTSVKEVIFYTELMNANN
jgi:2-polyprenyl-3-methyl-5-hydroxy-6-metoxy-1,4-benzoquinol methylase